MKVKDLLEVIEDSLMIAIYYCGEVDYFYKQTLPHKYLDRKIIDICPCQDMCDYLYITLDD